ncbi:unnamed protein product [Prorocentrum cordatum]|uniref:Uncharacterized protein n=1 Tax=Prorocentrum cordatum TaxID=2364126 RepID=A0ABN9QCA4_9DINO|nr:unnamed protein product [Polarella glacialis]
MVAHNRVPGQCCVCIPLKLGVTLIALYQFAYAFVCIFGLFVDDVRFQSGGYNTHTYRLQVMVGSAGFFFALAGLMGVADDKAVKSTSHFCTNRFTF